MKVYVTRFALTTGILKIDADIAEHQGLTEIGMGGTMIQQIGTRYPTFYHKPDWHLTIEEAITRAEEMKRAKIASLEKNLAKVKKIAFTPDNVKEI